MKTYDHSFQVSQFWMFSNWSSIFSWNLIGSSRLFKNVKDSLRFRRNLEIWRSSNSPEFLKLRSPRVSTGSNPGWSHHASGCWVKKILMQCFRGELLVSTVFNQPVSEDLAVIGRSCISGCCGSELAATITNIIYIQGEKTVLAASDIEPFYPRHRRRLLSTRNSGNRNATKNRFAAIERLFHEGKAPAAN